MENRKKYLFKNTLIFSLSSFSSKLIAFLLVPLYTYKLSTFEYGIADLLFTICGFLFPLLTFNIIESVFRFSIDKNSDKDIIINSGLCCNLICIILGLVAIPILNLFNDYKDYSVIFYFYLISVSLCQTFLSFLKGQEKLVLFSIGNVLNVLLVGILNVILLLVLNAGIYGFFLSYIIANIVTVIFVLIFGKIKFNFSKFDNKIFKKMVTYSTVLIPTNFMWWIMNSSDRIMITNYIGSDANGIYAVSYKIPTILTVIVSVFNQAWFFSAVREEDRNDREKQTNIAFNYLVKFSILINLIILFILKPFTHMYVSNAFYSSWQYVPILLVGFCFQTFSTFIATTYSVEKNNKGMLFSGLVGAISNIILNFILIPIIGVYGAAIATSLSYIVVFLYRYIDTKKNLKVNIFETKYLFLYLLLFVTNSTCYLRNELFYTLLNIISIIFLIYIRKDLSYFIKSLKGVIIKLKKNK